MENKKMNEEMLRSKIRESLKNIIMEKTELFSEGGAAARTGNEDRLRRAEADRVHENEALDEETETVEEEVKAVEEETETTVVEEETETVEEETDTVVNEHYSWTLKKKNDMLFEKLTKKWTK